MSGALTIQTGQNIVLDFQNHSLNNTGNKSIVGNYGNLEIINGNFTSNASCSVIENYASGVLTIEGSTVLALNKQGIVNKGTLYVKGSVDISSSGAYAIDNRRGASLVVTGGNIAAQTVPGIGNSGKLTVGTKDGIVNTTQPSIQGGTYGIGGSGSVKLYDGIIKGGGSRAIENESKVTDTESEYRIEHGTENTFKTAFLTKWC